MCIRFKYEDMTEGLKAQLDRFQKVRAAKLSYPQKRELAALTKEYGLRELQNLECGTCVRNAMDDVIAYLHKDKQAPVLQKVTLKMVKEPKDMKFHELRKYLSDKGIKFKRTDKKADLIKLI